MSDATFKPSLQQKLVTTKVQVFFYNEHILKCFHTGLIPVQSSKPSQCEEGKIATTKITIIRSATFKPCLQQKQVITKVQVFSYN